MARGSVNSPGKAGYDLDQHLNNKGNPHETTASQIELEDGRSVEEAIGDKQDKLAGRQGQVVGFDGSGNAVPMDPSSGGMTQEKADERYLKLEGGTVSGDVRIEGTISFGDRDSRYPYIAPGASGDVPTLEILGQFGDEDTRITGIANPQNENDAANKGYVDNAVSECENQMNESLALAVTTMSEQINAVAGDMDGKISGLQDAANGQGCGTCGTTAATVAKIGTLSGFVRRDGSVVALRFSYANTATSPTLNVNSTGAAPIYNCYTNAAVTSGDIGASVTHYFVYNGSQWVLLNPASLQAKPKSVSVSLTTSGWNASTKKQTVAVTGVVATVTAQKLELWATTETAVNALREAGVRIVSRAANSVTFACDAIPTANISCYVGITPLT